ncbi:MAG: nuclear transport factor 2 family protein [Vicinamibacteria bacterium]
MSPRSTAEKGRAAFEKFSKGLKTGDWSHFTDLLTEDFVFYFPQGKWHGEHGGKAKALAFFPYVTSVFPGGITVVSLDRVHVSGDTAMFEFKDEGTMVLPGAPPRPYKNRVAIAFDFRGDQVCGYREYFGSDGTSY